MSLRKRLSKLDVSVGWAPGSDESRRDFLERVGKRRGYVPRAVYQELVELHDQVARLEARIAALEGQ